MAKTPLEDWYRKTQKTDWDTFAAIKKTFNTVDNVGNKRIVFNVKGNDFRIVVIVIFTSKTLYIRFVGTHKVYDKIKNIKNI